MEGPAIAARHPGKAGGGCNGDKPVHVEKFRLGANDVGKTQCLHSLDRAEVESPYGTRQNSEKPPWRSARAVLIFFEVFRIDPD